MNGQTRQRTSDWRTRNQRPGTPLRLRAATSFGPSGLSRISSRNVHGPVAGLTAASTSTELPGGPPRRRRKGLRAKAIPSLSDSLGKDPEERQDLAQGHPDIARELFGLIKTHREPSWNPEWNFPPGQAANRKALFAFGSPLLATLSPFPAIGSPAADLLPRNVTARPRFRSAERRRRRGPRSIPDPS